MTEKTKKPKSHVTLWRRLTQSAFLILLNPYFLTYRNICFPVLNCWGCPAAAFSCPIGAMGQFLAAGVFPFLVLGTIIFFGGLMGRMLCGWVCPFGFLQDLMHKIPSPKLSLPSFFKYGKYATLLIMVLFIPIFFGITVIPGKTTAQNFFFCNYCPAGSLEATLPAVIFPPASSAGEPSTPPEAEQAKTEPLDETITPATGDAVTTTNLASLSENLAVPKSDNVILGLLKSPRIWILLTFLALFIMISRPFCRGVCPLGAMFALLNKFSAYKLNIDKDKCLDCKVCTKLCPVEHKVSISPNSPECIRCLECQKKCPKGAVENQYF